MSDKVLSSLKRKPYYKSANAVLYRADSLEIMNQLPENSIDMIFADPPYNLSNGGFTVHAGRRVSVDKGDWDKSLGVASDFEFHVQWIEACHRILKPGGTLWISGTYHSIYQCGYAVQLLGMKILNDISWFKPNAAPNLSGRYFTASHETLIWARKGEKTKHTFNYQAMKNGNHHERDFIKKDGKQLSLSQIYRILMNPFYYGYFKYPQDGPLYKGLHPPIITKELFDNVRARIDDIVPDNKATWGSKKFPFKHLFYCGSCGSRLTVEEHFKPLKDGTKRRHVYYRCTKSTKDPDCKELSIKANDITEQILAMVDAGKFDDVEPTEQLFRKIEQYKRVTSQLIKDHGIVATERQHFKNYASYILQQGTLIEKDNFVRGLNRPLYVKSQNIYL